MARICSEDDPNYPACLCDLIFTPGTPEHQQCIGDLTDEPDPPVAILNDCGCPVTSNERHPAGRVTVADTQHGDVGVENIRVVVRDNWFVVKRTQTDENGCWQITDRSYSGRAWVRIKFKSNRITTRGIVAGGDFSIWDYARAVRDNVGEINGPNFNDICINYVNPMGGNDLDLGRLYWYAAHANNSIYEYDDYAQQDGIAAPQNDIKVLMLNQDTPASAPMFRQMKRNFLFSISAAQITDGLISIALNDFIENGFLRGLVINSTNLFPFSWIKGYIRTFPPDVYYGYGGNGDIASDRVKGVFYHEYGHAAHFAALPNRVSYWLAEVAYIIDNFGYGDGTRPGAERAAVVELWGEYVGHVYNDRRYGDNHSNTMSTLPGDIEMTRHIYNREGFTPVLPPDNNDDWLPWDLFNDCVDDNPNHNGPGDGVMDFVTGYTINDCFDAVVNGSPTLMNDVENNLLQNLPIGETAADLQNLFVEYGY